MIMEFIPETLWSIAQCDGSSKPLMDLLYVKVSESGYTLFVTQLTYMFIIGKIENQAFNCQFMTQTFDLR